MGVRGQASGKGKERMGNKLRGKGGKGEREKEIESLGREGNKNKELKGECIVWF